MKQILSFFCFLMAMFFFNISIGKSVTEYEYIAGDLFLDDLESFEETVLVQDITTKYKVAPQTYKPHVDDLETLELLQDFVIYNPSNEVICFDLSTIELTNNTFYKFVYYKSFLNNYTPPPPRV